MIFNIGGYENIKGKLPEFTYTGTYELTDEGKDGSTQNWQIEFLTSGKLKFTKVVKELDLFVVGGGGAGATTNGNGGKAAGGGGYYKTVEDVEVAKNTEYSIVIGAAGDASGEAGGSSSALGHSANGGGAATAGASSYATCSCYGTTGTAGNVYQYSSTTGDASSLGSGYINLDLVYPLQTVEHENGTTLYVGKSNYYRCIVSSVLTIYYNDGTAGTGASSTQVFGTGDTVSGPGETAAATRRGQGGGTTGIAGGNGLVVMRNAR